ncbi:MAG: SDR family NAD(P)-dependent oxidoreductase [Aestuariivirga sp.]|nr:SDR family NAD(P)-dependent oxidoreductase [Aestuariivirga sp.]
MRFSGTVTVITGAGSGMGRAAALRIASEGGAVMCLDLSGDTARETAEKIKKSGGQADSAPCDVRNRAAIEAAVAHAKKSFGKITNLVNSAGALTMQGLSDMDEAGWNLVIDVNLKGVFLMTQACVPAIEEAGGGAIVNITSIEAEVVVASGENTQPHYASSKGGVKTMTRTLAHDLGRKNIRINAIAPGLIETGFGGSNPASDQYQEYVHGHSALRRSGRADEIAAAIAFLLSDDASYITGAQLPVDGGWLIY